MPTNARIEPLTVSVLGIGPPHFEGYYKLRDYRLNNDIVSTGMTGSPELELDIHRYPGSLLGIDTNEPIRFRLTMDFSVISVSNNPAMGVPDTKSNSVLFTLYVPSC